MIGEFQAMNVLCAVGMVIAMHGFSGKIIDSLPHLKGAPGRLDLAGRLANGAAVYVDYAHTPDALENVLKTMRHHTAGKLAVHRCRDTRRLLERTAQRIFEETHSREEFMKIFGRNYLDD